MINMELAKQRGISQENIEAINALHTLLERLIQSYTLDVPYQEARDLVESVENQLQKLWGFSVDWRYHTWHLKLNKRWMELTWAGRVFQCQETGVVKQIELDDVYECNLWPCGNGAIDLGRTGSYHRILGNLKEIM